MTAWHRKVNLSFDLHPAAPSFIGLTGPKLQNHHTNLTKMALICLDPQKDAECFTCRFELCTDLPFQPEPVSRFRFSDPHVKFWEILSMWLLEPSESWSAQTTYLQKSSEVHFHIVTFSRFGLWLCNELEAMYPGFRLRNPWMGRVVRSLVLAAGTGLSMARATARVSSFVAHLSERTNTKKALTEYCANDWWASFRGAWDVCCDYLLCSVLSKCFILDSTCFRPWCYLLVKAFDITSKYSTWSYVQMAKAVSLVCGTRSHCSCHCFGIRERPCSSCDANSFKVEPVFQKALSRESEELKTSSDFRNRYISHFATGKGKPCPVTALKAGVNGTALLLLLPSNRCSPVLMLPAC